MYRAFPNCSSLALAEGVSDAMKQNVTPSAILSFNAEPLLYALINANVVLNHRNYTRPLDFVARTIDHRKPGRISYHFCHGVLPVPNSAAWRRKASAPEKLVFLESEYLRLANSAFTSQATLFAELAMSHSIAFVGLSFSDPNLRRWLTWVHANRCAELRSRTGR